MEIKPIGKQVFPELNKKIKLFGLNPLIVLGMIVVFFPLNVVLLFTLKNVFGYVVAIVLDLCLAGLLIDSSKAEKNKSYSKFNQFITPMEKPIVTDKDNILNVFLSEDKRL